MKKAVSFLLAMIMLLAVPTAAFAGSDNCDCDNSPVVMVYGFGKEMFTEDGTSLSVGTKEILCALPSICGSVAALSAGNHELFRALLSNGLETLLGVFACNDDGTPKTAAVSYTTPTDTDIHRQYDGKEDNGKYIFGYDWRLDPADNADALAEYIEEVKAVTRHDKVVLCAHSEGTCVAAAYITNYGSENVEKTVFLSGAFQGITLVGEMFTKNITVDGKADAFELFIETFLGGTSTGDLVSSLIGVLNDAFILDLLLCLVNNLLTADLDALYDECLTELVTTMPGVWSFVPDEYYEDAKDVLYSGTDGKYDELIKTIDGYHYGVQCRLGEKLKSEQKKGLAVCVCMGYGIAPIPVYENSVDQTDMLIDTKFGSLGATCAPVGETLEDNGGKYLSADLLVDASTCTFPDSTWFVRRQDHNDFCEAYSGLIYYLISFDGQPTVWSSGEYPQFTSCDKSTHDKLSPVGEMPESDERPSIIRLGESIYRLIKEAVESK